MKNKWLLIILSVFLLSCGSTKIVPFDSVDTPKSPDYSKSESWAVLPGQYPTPLSEVIGVQDLKPIDVFFIYPTLFSDKKDPAWNADIYRSDLREEVIALSVTYQASAFTDAGNLYVPFYRQAHYKVFNNNLRPIAGNTWNIAYEDVKTAFEYYLEHYNKGKGIIIAGHSQGSMHGSKLVKDFFDGTELQSQLVAAYLPGAGIETLYFSTLKPLETPDSIGGYVSWNTYKSGKLPKRYESYYEGRLTSNPITWNNLKTTTFENHKGLLYYDKEIYPKSITIEMIDGMIWASLPRVPKRFFMSFIKNYHAFDINLFWKDISENAKLRRDQWLARNASQYSD
ncbi:MAG: DUF3089 domain-containing protein [Flavobacteriaceae bacterium]